MAKPTNSDASSNDYHSLEGLLQRLEELDGSEEAAVARSAMTAGIPETLVLEELRREVDRRTYRTTEFYS